MDYDDDDISHHNPQLTGEGRSKPSSLLRPYDFPKFDFDDNLQAHLRFDNLVETEVFLGIQSQEDNQWIEDFSRGSNGMEFNSTPADSCSISRRNNVWSEATSTESVEMLLKSVGQEERMPGESCIPDPSACCDQGTLVNHVESGHEANLKNEESVANADTFLEKGELCKDYPLSKTHAQEKFPEAEVLIVTQNNVESACGDTGTPKSEKQQSYHDDNTKESKTPDKSMTCETGKDSLNSTGLDDNVNSTIGISENRKHVGPGTGQKDSKILEGLTGQRDCTILEGLTAEASIPSHPVDDSHGLVAESGKLNSQESVEASDVCVRETTDRPGKGGSERSSEDDGKYVTLSINSQTDKDEVKMFPINSEVDGSIKECQDGLVVDGTDQHFTDLDCRNAEHYASTETKMDSSVSLIHRRDDWKVEEVHRSGLKNESLSDAPSNSLDDNKVLSEKSGGIDMAKTSQSSDMIVLGFAAENKEVANVEGSHSDSVATGGEPNARICTVVVHDPRQEIEDNLANRDMDVSGSGQNICNKEEDKKLVTGGGNVDFQTLTNDQMSQSLGVSIEVKANDVASHAMSHTLSGQDAHAENRKNKSDAVMLSHLDDCEEASTRLEPVSNVDNCVKSEVSVTDDVTRTQPSEMVAKSSQIAENNDSSSSGCPSMDAVIPLCSNHSQAHMDGDKIGLNESVKVDLINGGNCKVAKVDIEGEKDVDKASCGSPTIISSSELSPIEKDNGGEIKGPEVGNQSVKGVQSISEDPKRKDATGDDTTFTFKVNALPGTIERETGSCWPPFSSAEKCNSSVIVDETKLSGGRKTARTPKKKTSQKSAGVPDGEHAIGTSKGTSERKGRRSSAKGLTKENTKKEKQVKDINQESAKGDNVSNSLSGTSSIQNAHVGIVQHYRSVEQSNTKLSGGASLPDLNTSALINNNSQSASFRQPFSDIQQVQLRAQIFVYGSLIQGIAPDETCMVSAFGSSDGRRSWEPVWQSAVERVRIQKPNSSAAETPLHPESGARVCDAAVKEGSHLRTLMSPLAQPISKSTPAAIVNPVIPLSSPLWSISTPVRDNLPSSGPHKGPVMDYQRAVTPLHSYHTPPIRNFVGNAYWPPQSCFPSPWLASPQTSNSSLRYQPVSVTETVKLTPVKDTTVPLTSGVKHVTSSPVPTSSPSPIYAGVSLLPDPKSIASAERKSSDSKNRKRKKVKASDPSQISLLSETQPARTVVDSNAAAILTSPAVFPALASPAPPVSVPLMSRVPTDAVAVWSTDHSRKDDLNAGKGFPCSEETLSKVAEAKSQAEDAATLAAAAVSNSEDLWKQLSEQKKSGVTSEVEATVASAAVSIRAAASVAKAAAAAAKVASNVALQAKLMADEAFLSGKMSDSVQPIGKSSTDVCDIGNTTPASILKGDNITNQSNSILLAAKEAAKRRVEAASAASKQAENLDAIVKAAELAAAAVSQAGKLFAMGEPLPFNDILETGSQGYWKLTQSTSVVAENPRESCKSATAMEEGADISAKNSKENSLPRKGMKTVGPGKVHPRDSLNDDLVDGITRSMHTSESKLRSGKKVKVSKTVKFSGVISEPDPLPATGDALSNHDELVVGVLPIGSIEKGSSVEVFKHGDGFKSAWYSGNVLTLEDGKAYVCYTDLLSEQGSEKLCEWVPLEGEGGKPPIIRVASPLTTLHSQGTRKRRRGFLGDYAWCVGDRVDVWVDDGWLEGVVTEKFEKDETTLKVHFPAQDDTLVVRAWNLRTSRSWNDGKWVEVPSLEGRDACGGESDMPQEKRQKRGSSAELSKGKDKSANEVVDPAPALEKPEASKSLDLSISDRTFNVGKTTKENDKFGVRRPLRSGMPKEGSRVVFGVPKPTGKKRKFMEVSKHFPANKSDNDNKINDSVKFTKYLMRQPQSTRGWKVPSRNDPKEKRTTDSRTRAPSSRKSNRTIPRRDNLNSASAQGNENKTDCRKNTEHYARDDDTSGKAAHGSSSYEGVTEAPLSSLIAQSQSTSSKKVSSSSTKSERINRGKTAPSSGKLSKIEGKVYASNSGQTVSEFAEPRRSNRRFQPTHRLLEGLQSSMVIPKMTSVSHDKGQKNPSRNFSARGK